VNLAHTITTEPVNGSSSWLVVSVTDFWAQRKGESKSRMPASKSDETRLILGSGNETRNSRRRSDWRFGWHCARIHRRSRHHDIRAERLANYPSKYPHNLSLERPPGSEPLTAAAEAVTRLEEPVDVLWIATKTYQLQNALELIRTPPRHVVPIAEWH
jgi:hypothetical protein